MDKTFKEWMTPCGKVTVADGDGTCIPFAIRKNLFDCPCEFEDRAGTKVTLKTDASFSLAVAASDLTKGKTYRIMLNGTKLGYGDSDEKTECLSARSNGYCIALGTYLPNDDEKMAQARNYSRRMGFLNSVTEPPEYNTERFAGYDVEMSDDCSGFRFYLIDDSISEISFEIAWIKSDGINDLEYESAVQFWTT